MSDAVASAGTISRWKSSFLSTSILISAVRGLGRGAAFGAALLASRRLPAAGFGLYAYVLTFFGAVGVAGGLGLEQVALTGLGRARATRDGAALDAVLASILRRSTIVIPLVTLAFAVPFHAVLKTPAAFWSVLGTVVCLNAIVISSGILRGLDRPLASSAVQESGRGPTFLLGAGVLCEGAGLAQVWTATLLFTALAAVSSIVAALHAARRAGASSPFTMAATRGKDRAAVRSQIRFVLILLATNAYLWICPVLLAREATLTEVGGFNVAMQFPSLISFLSTSLEVIYVSKIAAYWHAGSLGEIRPLLRAGSRLTLIVGVPLTVVLIAFGPSLLSLYGPRYSVTYPAMLLILAAQAFSVFCGPCGYLVLLTGRENLNLAGMAAGALAGVLYLAAFAGSYGHHAAAVAFLVATFVPNLLFAVYCIRSLKINPTLVAAFERE